VICGLLIFGKDWFCKYLLERFFGKGSMALLSFIASAGLVFSIVLFIIIIVTLVTTPKAGKSVKKTCEKFYTNMQLIKYFDPRYKAFVCLSESAKQEYDGYDGFLRTVEGWNSAKNNLIISDITYTKDISIIKATVKFHLLENKNQSYVSTPNLIQIGNNWYIDVPKEDANPVKS
jgi:hypothetical protein